MKRMVLFAAIASAGFVAHAEGLRFVTAELPPYTFQVPPATVAEEPGPGQGLVHEAVQEMARRLNTSVAIEYMDWDGAQKLALGQPNVGILSITRTPEREDHYQWCCRIVTDDLILVGGQGVDVSSLEKVRDRPIGVLFEIGADASTLNFGQIVRPSEIYLAFSKGTPEAEVQRWAGALKSIQDDGTLERILARYSRLKVEPIADDRRRFTRGSILW